MRIREWNRLVRSGSGIPPLVDNYLLQQERVVVTIRKHPGVFVGQCLVAVCWCGAAALATVFTDSNPLAVAIVWGGFLTLLVWLLIRVIAWAESYFVVTEMRLIFINKLAKQKVVSVPLREVAAFDKRRSLMGRLVGYGELVAKPTKSDYSIPKMNYMPYFEQMFAEVMALLPPVLMNDEDWPTATPQG